MLAQQREFVEHAGRRMLVWRFELYQLLLSWDFLNVSHSRECILSKEYASRSKIVLIQPVIAQRKDVKALFPQLVVQNAIPDYQ